MTILQESDEEIPENITFAPKDVNPIKIGAKDNVHGIGYRGLDPRKALPATHVSLFPAPAITKTGKKGIRGTVCILNAPKRRVTEIHKSGKHPRASALLNSSQEYEGL